MSDSVETVLEEYRTQVIAFLQSHQVDVTDEATVEDVEHVCFHSPLNLTDEQVDELVAIIAATSGRIARSMIEANESDTGCCGKCQSCPGH